MEEEEGKFYYVNVAIGLGEPKDRRILLSPPTMPDPRRAWKIRKETMASGEYIHERLTDEQNALSGVSNRTGTRRSREKMSEWRERTGRIGIILCWRLAGKMTSVQLKGGSPVGKRVL
jgi:hypothetical protein